MAETLRRTTLGRAACPATDVNIEPAMRMGDRMGGHWVQGHVDGVGEVTAVVPDGDGVLVTFAAPHDVLRYTIEKGSVCVSGVSLTVTAIDDESFTVALIPHTRAVTTLGRLEPGRARQPRGRPARQVRRKAGRNGCPGTIEAVLMSIKTEYQEAYPELDASTFATVEEAIAEVRAGRMVVVVDSPDRENEGDLCMAAEHVTPAAINFMATHARGLICLALEESRCDELGLHPMTTHNETPLGTAFTVSVEARTGVSTGISVGDRAHTIRVVIDPATKPADLVQPGHMFPLRARGYGVLERMGQTEASVDLARLAGLTPAGVICEIMNDDGTMARVPDLVQLLRPPRAEDDHRRPTWSPTGAAPSAWSSGSPSPTCPPSTAPSPPTATGR